VLARSLGAVSHLVNEGETGASALKATMARLIGSEPLAKLDYVAVMDEATWEDVEAVRGPCRALAAARFGAARLIDNVALPWPAGSNRGE
jgi:pantoate--beta-alanine ligase